MNYDSILEIWHWKMLNYPKGQAMLIFGLSLMTLIGIWPTFENNYISSVFLYMAITFTTSVT